MQFDENGTLIVPDNYKLIITISYNENPSIQTISNTVADLRPTTEHREANGIASSKR